MLISFVLLLISTKFEDGYMSKKKDNQDTTNTKFEMSIVVLCCPTRALDDKNTFSDACGTTLS